MSRDSDIEMNAGQASNHPSLGFAALSSWIVSDKDQELLLFRKFGEISARNILYLQCELLVLEEKLKKWDKNVSNSGDTALEQAAETWEIMVEQAEAERQRPETERPMAGRPGAKEMMELVTHLRIKIKEYHEALVLHSRVAQLQSPGKRALEVARNELHGGSINRYGYKPNPILGGKAKDYLDDTDDLISLKATAAVDPLSKVLRAYWPGKEEASRDGLHLISRYDERSITIAVAIINILVAIVLLVGSISSLYYVESPAAILGIICGFTILFALSVGLVTNAKRAEIFAGSAAYAAVLVVFVGNGDLSGYVEKARFYFRVSMLLD
ncbi:hypothetical protein FSARC_1701 [Fusarium sarcochroum]|uniref:DUF6594 domain-containing protein n=1 Tax=Fusarium sarcochroum TaxID=1208366 RepID=A0A8H4U816_9HYPO|nr:hypothetical protein FSARC_1701 [Fusarium sarcochroum]